MYILKRLRLLLEQLDENDLNYKIAQYIIDNPKEVKNLTVRDLAKKIFVSPSSIIRFIKVLGIEEYRDFKTLVSFDVKREHEINKQEGIGLSVDEELLGSLVKDIDIKKLTYIVNKVDKAKNIIFYIEPEYIDIVNPFINRLTATDKTIEILTYKKYNTQKLIIDKLNEKDLIFMVFPTLDYYMLKLYHLENNHYIINEIDSKKCSKIYMGQQRYVLDSNYYSYVIHHNKDYLIYKIDLTMIIKKLIEMYDKKSLSD